jgi:hypothetical protein
MQQPARPVGVRRVRVFPQRPSSAVEPSMSVNKNVKVSTPTAQKSQPGGGTASRHAITPDPAHPDIPGR